MDSVSMGNFSIFNPTDDQKMQAKAFNDERERKRDEMDTEAVQIYILCRTLECSLSIKELSDHADSIMEIQNRRNRLFRGLIWPRPQPYKCFINDIKNMISRKSPEWWTIPIVMDHNEKVNGFFLHDIKEDVNNQMLFYSHFQELEILYNTPNTMTKEEFMDKYYGVACSDWSKQDECGECYGGFWKYPEDSYEYKNAWDLSRTANGEALYKLPYSHALIFETIELGCANRQESVRYSNSFCEYVKRKLTNKTKWISRLTVIDFLKHSLSTAISENLNEKHMNLSLRYSVKPARLTMQSVIPAFRWTFNQRKKRYNRSKSEPKPKNFHVVKLSRSFR